MCWETKTILKPIKHKAQKDIQAKKVLRICHNGDLSSPFFEMMKWVPETQYTISEGLNLINVFPKNVFNIVWRIDEGFHCYSMNNKVGLNKIGSIVVKKGSNYVTSMFNDFSDLKVFEVIIPQGSTYYENEDGEIVSDNMILKNELLFDFDNRWDDNWQFGRLGKIK